MFKDDKMMTLLTGLVLAIFAGTMVQYGDSIVSLLSSDNTESTEDDYFTALSGSEQKLDVLANDILRGPLAITSVPACGSLRLGVNQTLVYQSDSTCEGEQVFSYCVVGPDGCTAHDVTISVVGSTAATTAVASVQTPETVVPEQAPVATAQTSDAVETPAAVEITQQAAADATPQSVGSPAPVVVNAMPVLVSPDDSAPDVDTVVASIRPPMLAAPQIGEFVAPGDAAAQLRSEAAALSAANLASNEAVSVTANTSIGQMDTGFTAPSLGDEGVSLGRSVVVAGTSLGSAGGPEVESSAAVAIAALDQQSTVSAAQAPALSATESSVADRVEILAQGPFAPEETQVLTTFADPNVAANDANIGGNDQQFTGETVIAATATLPSPDVAGLAVDNTVALIDASPTLATLDLEDTDVLLDRTSDIALLSTTAPAAARTIDSGLQTPPAPDTSSNMPLALVSAATTLLPSIDATPERPRLLMRHVALNTAPVALAATDPAIVSPPSIDSSAAPALQTASLVPEATGPAESVPGDTVCDIALDTLSRPGAEVELIVSAACRPNEMFTVSHAGLMFSAMTGDDGSHAVRFPAMETAAKITVEFSDGAQARTLAMVSDADSMLRSGISWQGDSVLALNAYEFGALPGSLGHVSAATPRDYRAARILGGGYMVELGDVDSLGAAHSIIYSMPVSRATPEGIITLSLQIESAGSACGGIAEITTFRSENAAAFSRLQNIELGACNAAPPGEFAGVLDDLWTAAR